MAANIEIDERGVPYYRFPPFPDTPPGVEIVPFDQFKPSGIVMDMDPDAPEVDGMGIRTVRLKAKHNNEGQPVVKKKTKKVKLPTGEQITRRSAWWEEWAEGEDLRSNHFYNAMMPREDRLERASQDFHKGRNWGTPENGLQAMYDQFRLYIGLIGNPTVPFRKRPRGAPAVDDEYDSDSGPEDPPEEPVNAEPEKTEVGIVEGAKDARAINEKIQSQVEESEMFVLDEKYHQRVQAELEAKEARLEAFLDDPEVAMRIFFSSYFFEKGLAWADQKLRDVPLLASFFLRFIQRNRVLPEASRSLARAIEVVDKAKTELPMTKKITQKLPDFFGKACRELWGEREPSNIWLAPLEPYSEDEDSDEEGLRRRQTKRARIEEVTDANEVASVQVFPEPPQDASMEVDNENLKGTPTNATSNDDTSSAWPAASGDQEMSTGWGGSDEDKGGWGILNPPGEDGDTPRDALGQPLDLSGWSNEQPSLMVLLGPTTIPLTHRVGITELSTRKIVSWSMPPQPVPSGLVGTLRGVLAEVVLAPWDEYSEAKGASVVAPRLVSPDGEEVITTHNPLTDIIRVLMHPTAAAALHAGMGIQGLWVQAVPRVVRDSESKNGTNDSPSGSRGKGHGVDGNGAHNGRGGKKGRGGRGGGKSVGKDSEPFWYMERVQLVVPCYWTEGA